MIKNVVNSARWDGTSAVTAGSDKRVSIGPAETEYLHA